MIENISAVILNSNDLKLMSNLYNVTLIYTTYTLKQAMAMEICWKHIADIERQVLPSVSTSFSFSVAFLRCAVGRGPS